MATPSADAAMGPEIFQAAPNADPCHNHSKDFADVCILPQFFLRCMNKLNMLLIHRFSVLILTATKVFSSQYYYGLS